MWDPGNKPCRAFAGSDKQEASRRAGPPQARHGPLGGQRSTRSDKRGGRISRRAAPREISPLGGQRSTRSDKRGGHIRGFTLIELLLVVSLIVMVSAGVGFAMRDAGQNQLEREAQRLVALLESARAQSRATGVPVYWQAGASGFEFTGLPPARAATESPSVDTTASESTGQALITPWLSEGISVLGAEVVTLGPEPIIERQQILLSLGSRSLRITTDGLRPFTIDASPAAALATTSP